MTFEDGGVLCIWHGYLLNATGSNIYTHHLVRSWVARGRDVVLACQEPDPASNPSIHEVVRLAWSADGAEQVVASRQELRMRAPGEGRCVMVVPDIDGVLPVYVLDRYAGFDVHRLVDLDAGARARYDAAQAAAMRFVVDAYAPAGVLINHATPLPAALAPVLGSADVPFAVKVHGSELEYALAEDSSLAAPACDALSRAASIVVGSEHIARRTEQLLGAGCLGDRVEIVPPGVDLEAFSPSPAGPGGDRAGREALASIVAARAIEQPGGRTELIRRELDAIVARTAGARVEAIGELVDQYEERHVEATAADAVAAIPDDARLITFVGKLIPQKGPHLLLGALPSILEAHPNAHVVAAGFGPERNALEALLLAMQHGDHALVEEIATRAGSLAGAGGAALAGLPEHLAELRSRGKLDSWYEAAARHRVAEHVTWLGLVDHSILHVLWPECEVSIVPSILAEAFGMVAAEAAACGCIPLVADHSGLADAARVIERGGVAPVRVCFEPIDGAVDALARSVIERLDLPTPERARQARTARENVAAAWGWDALADDVATLMTRR